MFPVPVRFRGGRGLTDASSTVGAGIGPMEADQPQQAGVGASKAAGGLVPRGGATGR